MISRRAYLCLFIYFAVNLVFLTQFPYMHSDESWLSGLSRQIASTGDIAATEPFFDLKERNPHAIRLVFHILQAYFLKVFGYNLFGARVLSLTVGVVTLYFFAKLASIVFKCNRAAWFCTALLGLDIQFIYTSHFARQEIVLLLVFTFSIYYLMTHLHEHRHKHDMVLALVLGLGIGVHPNSLLVALTVGGIYIYHILATRRLQPAHLLNLVGAVALSAFVFIALSRHMDPNFITNYIAHGREEFEVFSPIMQKGTRLLEYYLRIWKRQGGTYYIPNIRPQLLVFSCAAAVTSVGLSFTRGWMKREGGVIAIVAILVLNGGLLLIGRFNYTSIVFIFPFGYLLVTACLTKLPTALRRCISLAVFSVIISTTLLNFVPFIDNDYDAYLRRIAYAVARDKPVLASLNTEYALKPGLLHDFRNLAYLRRNNLSFSEYIRRYKIRYVIYTESLDYIHRHKPKWNGVYGSLACYQEMRNFLADECRVIDEFASAIYGIEIAERIGDRDWQVTVYEVLPFSSSQ